MVLARVGNDGRIGIDDDSGATHVVADVVGAFTTDAPGSGVSAVLMNLTAVIPDRSTFITVYPTGAARPLASNLDVLDGRVMPKTVLAPVGADGSVAIYDNDGHVDLVADVMGYVTR
jgi:hypothetical protein